MRGLSAIERNFVGTSRLCFAMLAHSPPSERSLERTALDLWLRQDLHAQNGPLRPVPDELLAMIDAAGLPH